MKSIDLYSCTQCGLKFFFPSVVGSSDFYSVLQKKLDWYYLSEKPEFELAAKYIKDDMRVCEVGCGQGNFSHFISPKSYVGLELNHSVAQSAAAKGIDVKFESLSDHADQNPNSYDVVCAFQVLEHVTMVKNFFESAQKCLKKNGLLIFSVPDGESFLGTATNVYLNMPPHHQSLWTASVFQKAASILNLTLVDVHHEHLSEEHRLFYLSTLFQKRIYGLFSKKPKFIDTTLSHKMLAMISMIYAKFANSLRNPIKSQPRGFALTAVLRKN